MDPNNHQSDPNDQPPEEENDDAPAFIDMSSAIEVNVDDAYGVDGAEPMEEDADMADADTDGRAGDGGDANDANGGMDGMAGMAEAIIDKSKVRLTSHSDAIYATACHYEGGRLTIASGGGDDRAFLHFVTANTTNNNADSNSVTVPLLHKHSDSISCVALNASHIHSAVTPNSNSSKQGKAPPQQKKLVAVGCYDGAIVLYDAEFSSGNGAGNAGNEGRKEIMALEGPSDVEWCCWHPKGGTVLLAGSIADGTIWMYHILISTNNSSPQSQCLQVFVGHEGGVTSGAFTPDGKWVVTAGQDGTVRVWAPKTGMSKHVFRLMEVDQHSSMGDQDEEGQSSAGLTCLAVGGGADGQLAIAGGEDGTAYVVHISGKKVVATLPHFEATAASAVNSASNDHGDDEEEEAGEARSVEAVGFCPGTIAGTAHWCATGGVDGILKIWNLGVGGSGAQLRQRCQRDDASAAGGAGITRLKWHNTLPLVIASYTDGVVCIWDVRTGKVVEMLTGHEDMINDLDVCFAAGDGSSGPASAIVVTGSDDKSVRMFEFVPSS